MSKQERVVNTVLAVAFSLVAMGLIGNWTQQLTKDTPKHTSSLKQYAQPCNPNICVMR